MLDSLGVYIHFPWCVKKCPYCDFNSHPLREHSDFDGYASALVADFKQQSEDFQLAQDVTSAFLGGGTPSLFLPESIAEVLQALPLAASCEVTMEANPGTTEHADFGAYRQAGVNRLSIGAQTFDDAALKRIGRIHSAAETHHAFGTARDSGFANINLDLMWGLPGQSVDAALADLATAVALGPEHISWYQLTIEAKTEFARRTPLLPQDATLAAIEDQGLAYLAQQGYERYEVSAFAKGTGTRRCAHNLNYWQFGDYLGVGAGAHGKITQRVDDSVQVLRSNKPSQPRLYQAAPDTTEMHIVETTELPLEFMMNALRLVDGVGIDSFTETTGLDWSCLESTWSRLVQAGWVLEDRIATTPLGLRYLDTVVAEFID
jgi:oxygen-independent coproporphyrinogen-3 oxidase